MLNNRRRTRMSQGNICPGQMVNPEVGILEVRVAGVNHEITLLQVR